MNALMESQLISLIGRNVGVQVIRRSSENAAHLSFIGILECRGDYYSLRFEDAENVCYFHSNYVNAILKLEGTSLFKDGTCAKIQVIIK